MSGYVHIHRTLLGHPAFRHDGEALAFAWLIIRAAWRPTRVRYKGHAISLKRGELAVSIRDFAAAIDRDKAWCDRLWKRLTRETMIETRSETGVTVITICNYDDYQSDRDDGETVRKPRREPANETGVRQRRDTEQEEKKGRKEDQSSRVRAREAALPTDVRSVMEEAGFVSPPPDIAMLKDWYDAGASLEQDILPCVRRVTDDLRSRTGRGPFKLKVFDAAIREKLAADDAEIERLRRIRRNLEHPEQAGFRV